MQFDTDLEKEIHEPYLKPLSVTIPASSHTHYTHQKGEWANLANFQTK
jgi:hypothetical protein